MYMNFVCSLLAPKTSIYTKYSIGESRYFGVDENNGNIFVAGILFGQANKVLSLLHLKDMNFTMHVRYLNNLK